MWNPIRTPADVPPDLDVRLAVIDAQGAVHALVFPCRRVGATWVDAKTRRTVEIYPSHWQRWSD